MSQYFVVHSENPQTYLLCQAANIIQSGGVIVYPTDSAYALGCQIGNKVALERIQRIRGLNKNHHFTLMCRDLSEISIYARIDNAIFRTLKAHTPGAYTFILPATKEVPRRLLHPKRKTIGIRVPENRIAQSLLDQTDQPLLTTSLILPGQELPLIEPEAIRDRLGKQVDLIISGGYCGIEQTSVIEFIDGNPKILRYGKGNVEEFEI